jgi:hypothetical protein
VPPHPGVIFAKKVDSLRSLLTGQITVHSPSPILETAAGRSGRTRRLIWLPERCIPCALAIRSTMTSLEDLAFRVDGQSSRPERLSTRHRRSAPRPDGRLGGVGDSIGNLHGRWCVQPRICYRLRRCGSRRPHRSPARTGAFGLPDPLNSLADLVQEAVLLRRVPMRGDWERGRASIERATPFRRCSWPTPPAPPSRKGGGGGPSAAYCWPGGHLSKICLDQALITYIICI